MDDTNKQSGQMIKDVLDAYKSIFNTDNGKLVLHDLCKKGCILRPTFDPISEYASARNEGKRELCLYILERIEYDESKLLALVKRGATIEEEYFN